MNKVSLITGASGGLGLALAQQLAGRGQRLVLVARDSQALERAADALTAAASAGGSERPLVFACDLGVAGSVARLVAWLQRQDLVVERLINNAGVGLNGAFVDADAEATQRMLLLNINALTELCLALVPAMRERGSGQVLNVASVAAYQPAGPGMAAYYASKAYVLSLSRGLNAELKGSGVSVTALCPAPMATGFFNAGSGFADSALNRLPKLGVDKVAKIALRAMLAGREVVLPGLLARLLAVAGMLPPRGLATQVNAYLLRTGGAA